MISTGTLEMMRCSRFALASVLTIALAAFAGRERASATPVFAQAYGLSCTACHTQMPMLNAFGRYIQRTGYAALNPQTLKHAVPVFLFDVGTGYTHQSGNSSGDHITGPFHSTLLQANGALSPDVTYKIEQFMVVGGQAGFLEQGWIAYHNFFDHHGHLFVGKLAGISLDEYGAAVLADVNDASQGRLPNIDVGVHNYALDYDGGRWGTKFNYVRGKTLLQIAYLGNPTFAGSFADAYDYAPASDKSLQWRAAYADPAKPYEVGVFGETGSLGFTGSELVPGQLHLDNYNVVAPYVNKDPRPGSPGFRFGYAFANDSNPGSVATTAASGNLQPVGSTASSWMIGSAYQMVLHDHGMVSLTAYHTNQALGEVGLTGTVQAMGPQTGGGPGFSYAINPYTRVYTAITMAQNERPAFSVVMWFTPPLWGRLK